LFHADVYSGFLVTRKGLNGTYRKVLSFLRPEDFKVKLLHFFPRPRRLSEKGEAGFEGGIILEAIDFDFVAQFFPAIMIDKLVEYHFEGFSVEGVVKLLLLHIWI